MIELLSVHRFAEQVTLHEVTAVSRKPFMHYVVFNAFSGHSFVLRMAKLDDWLNNMFIIGVH